MPSTAAWNVVAIARQIETMRAIPTNHIGARARRRLPVLPEAVCRRVADAGDVTDASCICCGWGVLAPGFVALRTATPRQPALCRWAWAGGCRRTERSADRRTRGAIWGGGPKCLTGSHFTPKMGFIATRVMMPQLPP